MRVCRDVTYLAALEMPLFAMVRSTRWRSRALHTAGICGGFSFVVAFLFAASQREVQSVAANCLSR